MTKLFDEAIKRVRELPEAIQNEAAEILFAVASKRAEPVHLDDDTQKAVLEGKTQGQARRIRVRCGDRCVLPASGRMRPRYAVRALADLEEISRYLEKRRPAALQAFRSTVERQIGWLSSSPYRAPATDEPGVRELTLS
jgi:hypothetical protein